MNIPSLLLSLSIAASSTRRSQSSLFVAIFPLFLVFTQNNFSTLSSSMQSSLSSILDLSHHGHYFLFSSLSFDAQASIWHLMTLALYSRIFCSRHCWCVHTFFLPLLHDITCLHVFHIHLNQICIIESNTWAHFISLFSFSLLLVFGHKFYEQKTLYEVFKLMPSNCLQH